MPRSKKKQPVRRFIGEYEGSDIVGTAIKFAGSGTNLADALTLDGRRFQRNERVAVLVEGRIKNVGYGDADKDEPAECIEIGTLDIEQGRIVSGDVAERMLREEKERIQKLRDAVDGQGRLDEEQASIDKEERLAKEEAEGLKLPGDEEDTELEWPECEAPNQPDSGDEDLTLCVFRQGHTGDHSWVPNGRPF